MVPPIEHEALPFVEHVAAPIDALDFVLDGLCQDRHVPVPYLAQGANCLRATPKIASARVSAVLCGDRGNSSSAQLDTLDCWACAADICGMALHELALRAFGNKPPISLVCASVAHGPP
jgi:hypothetical protein